MSLTIRTRLTLWYVALLTVVVLGLGVFLVVRLQAGLVRGVDEGLGTRAAQIALGLDRGCEGEFQDVSDASLVGLPQGESGAQLLAPDGSVMESTGDPTAQQPLIGSAEIAGVMAGSTARSTVTSGPDQERFRVLAVRLPAGSCDGAVVVATSLDDVARSQRELIVQLLIAGPVVIACSAAGGWWLARRALSPVARMTREADTIGIERLDDRIEVPGSADELQDLAITLNSMLDRLERGVEDKRRFAADASHELRTPLAVMSAELEVSLRSSHLPAEARATLESAQEEVERMRTIVENLLTLARADDGTLELLRTPVDLHDVAQEAAAAGTILARPRGVDLEVVGPPARVEADHARILQVLSNLASNAIRYSPEGGTVTITTWARDGGAGCTITDDGPGVPPESAGRIFERFVRVDPARAGHEGSGLGLSICREIVQAHAGRIWVDARAGAGGSFSFWLPGTL